MERKPNETHVVFDETLVREIPLPPTQPTTLNPARFEPSWPAQQHQRLRQIAAQQNGPRTQLTLGTMLDRLLEKAVGREPLSTLVLTIAGGVIAVAQEDPTNWRGWLHGAVIALVGRMMNERY